MPQTIDQLRNEKISDRDLLDLLWMARRYADGRMSYATSLFNEIYARLPKSIRETERNDDTVPSFPFASDGMGNNFAGIEKSKRIISIRDAKPRIL